MRNILREYTIRDGKRIPEKLIKYMEKMKRYQKFIIELYFDIEKAFNISTKETTI